MTSGVTPSGISDSCTRELSLTGGDPALGAAGFECGMFSGWGCCDPTGAVVFPAFDRA